MALYMKIPKDIDGIKDTVVSRLTKRQIIFYGIGLALGFTTYWLTYKPLGTTTAAILLFALACPFFIAGMYVDINSKFTLEQKLAIFIRYNLFPKIRPYQTENIYRKMQKCTEYKKEVRMLEIGRKEVNKIRN